MEPHLPDRFDLDDVVVRRFTPDDVPALVQATRQSYEHLHPWMSWATPEGTTEEALRRFVDESIALPADGPEAIFGIFAKRSAAPTTASDSDGLILGSCGLHDRVGPGAIEIGYWLHVDATGRGLMTRVAGTLTELALASGEIGRVEIHCDEANLASAAVPRRLGYTLITVRAADRPGGAADTGRHMVWAYGPDVDVQASPGSIPT